MKKTIIIMPVANEEDTMQKVIDDIMALPYDNLYLYTIIDDYSQDNTENIIRNAQILYSGRVKCIYFKESKGVASCYLYGYRMAIQDHAEFIIEMDGGGSHDAKYIPQFIECLEQGYKCVWGSRFMGGGQLKDMPLYRRLLSKSGTILANIVLRTGLHDMTSGYEAFSVDVLDKMNFNAFLSRGHMFQTEMKYYCRKYSYQEIPFVYIGGDSTLKIKTVVSALEILFQLKKNEEKIWLT